MYPSDTTGAGRPLRVLLLTQNLDVWGAQRQIVELARGLSRAGHDVRLGALEPTGALMPDVERLGIPVLAFARNWRWDLSPVRRLTRYLRRERIDVVHSFLFLPNFYARLAGRLARTPGVVSSLRSTGIEGAPRYALDIATCGLCDVLVANSRAGADHYIRRGGLRGRIVVVRNGYSPRPVPPRASLEAARTAWGLDRFETLVGMVAALEERKDQALLIRAIASVRDLYPRVGLVLAGEGGRRAELEGLVRSLGLESTVVMLGRIDQPELLYPLLDVYVQASFAGEGISNSLVEAMANGLPTIATDIGGNREVVVDGETGYIVPPRDVAALASLLGRVVADPSLRRGLGAAGRQRAAADFSADAMVAETVRIYNRLLQGRPILASATGVAA